MGISGLLPLLKSIQKPCSLKQFSGQTIGVDAYGWLHRGAAACAIDLAHEKPTTKLVDFCMHRVRMLRHFGVTPFLVFDGDYLPSKAATEANRASKREESRQLGLELYRIGKKSQAHLELQKAVDVSPEMARQLIEELKATGVQYIVAPYEADAQLVYLERNGIISGILSEDSDLLVFGAKCLLTKLDQHGDCVEIRRTNFTACKEISLVGWSDADFRCMAILSGCDYLASMNKMGLKTAYRLVRKHKTIERVLRAVQFDGQFRVPAGYLQAFRRAEMTFLHQRVFCPIKNALVMNTLPNEELDEDVLSAIGQDIESGIAIGVARGDLHPMTKKPLVFERPRKTTPKTPFHFRKPISSADDLKGRKPIDTFFKPKRTPLAELDPNSFTPSPSQERLLQQRPSGQWSASPAVAPSSLRVSPSSTRIPTPQSAPTLLQRVAAHPRLTSTSAPRPQKRQRLCADDNDKPPARKVKGGIVEKSRFFASPMPVPSRSNIRDPQRKPGKKQDRNIWSDDSLDEALANLPDFGEPLELAAKPPITIFEDEGDSDKPSIGGELSHGRRSQPYSQTKPATIVSQVSEFDPFVDPASPPSREAGGSVRTGFTLQKYAFAPK
ncbi:MAG: Rad2 nuclease [Geoglossum umbratile]|nr:MAG: Rad2 nuclease [Geoglossum umbratile]